LPYDLDLDIYAAEGTTTALGLATTLIDANRTEIINFWNGQLIYITSGACKGQVREIVTWSFALKTFTVSPAFSAAIQAGTTYKVLANLAADIETAAIQAQTDKLPNTQHETEWAIAPVAENIASAALTTLTAGSVTPTFPTGSTRVRAILVASIHVTNQAGNTHHISFKIQGQKAAGGYTDLLDLTAVASLGLVTLDGAGDGWCGAIDVTAKVDASAVQYDFRFVVKSDNAGSVNYTTSFTLVLVYTM